jgi:hypothetical protein
MPPAVRIGEPVGCVAGEDRGETGAKSAIAAAFPYWYDQRKRTIGVSDPEHIAIAARNVFNQCSTDCCPAQKSHGQRLRDGSFASVLLRTVAGLAAFERSSKTLSLSTGKTGNYALRTTLELGLAMLERAGRPFSLTSWDSFPKPNRNHGPTCRSAIERPDPPEASTLERDRDQMVISSKAPHH